MKMNKSSLPGVGKRISCITKDNQMMAIIAHHTGKRELYFFEDADDDEAAFTMSLSSEETREIGAQLLGTTMEVEQSDKLERLHILRKQVVMEWIEIHAGSPFVDKNFEEIQKLLPEDVSIVGIIQSENFQVNPGCELMLRDGDIVMAVGKNEPMRQFMTRCEKGAGA
ncbi:cation:proton antiporter regulatory subunit [Paenibacillus sp. 1P07SE]|uniref:cation:proton antiporter regulatory subunit n=1 Tax=Paenibacillus sp. 1P07SE TaxID=3132209 RepID=UPI0039A4E76B